jgi:hypothetical protein
MEEDDMVGSSLGGKRERERRTDEEGRAASPRDLRRRAALKSGQFSAWARNTKNPQETTF